MFTRGYTSRQSVRTSRSSIQAGQTASQQHNMHYVYVRDMDVYPHDA